MKHRAWIAFSGFVWFFIGTLLLYKGLQFITEAIQQPDSLCVKMQNVFGGPQQAATFLIAAGLLIGFVKGRFVLAKTVRRVTTRIAGLSLPIRVQDVYSPSYWILMGGMVLLGVSFKYLPLPIDVRGVIDVAIGSALVNGAMLYFRAAKSLPLAHL